MNVVCVGDCGVDRYLPGGSEYFGGITANVARHARKEFPPDDNIHIVSCVGDDQGGQLVLASLKDSGIHCHLSHLPGSTPLQTIEVQPNGERRFVAYDEGVLKDFAFDEEQRMVIADSDLLAAPVYLQIIGLFDELMSITTRGIVAIDFADFLQHPDFELLKRHMAAIDIAYFGLTVDDSSVIGELQQLASTHDKLFIVTLGPDGSRAFHGSRSIEIAAAAVERVVDTTGAGDAYTAGFLSHYCHGGDIAASMYKGAALAAGVITTFGVGPH